MSPKVSEKVPERLVAVEDVSLNVKLSNVPLKLLHPTVPLKVSPAATAVVPVTNETLPESDDPLKVTASSPAPAAPAAGPELTCHVPR
jgi:hypothetical protein